MNDPTGDVVIDACSSTASSYRRGAGHNAVPDEELAKREALERLAGSTMEWQS
jgi:hypothetical protein